MDAPFSKSLSDNNNFIFAVSLCNVFVFVDVFFPFCHRESVKYFTELFSAQFD